MIPHEKRAANLLPRRKEPWHSSWQSGRKSLNTVQRVLRTIVYQGIPRILSLGTPFVGSRLVGGVIYELTLVQNMILKGGPKSSASSHFSSIFDLFFRSKKGYTLSLIHISEPT